LSKGFDTITKFAKHDEEITKLRQKIFLLDQHNIDLTVRLNEHLEQSSASQLKRPHNMFYNKFGKMRGQSNAFNAIKSNYNKLRQIITKLPIITNELA